MFRAIIFIFVFSLIFSNNSYAAKCVDRLGRTGECMSVTVSGGVQIDGVFYMKRALDGRHVLKFELASGLVVSDSSGSQREAALNSKHFVEALGILMSRIRKEGKDIDRIQVDLRLVDDVWLDSRSAVRSSIQEGSGVLDNKDISATVALRQAISKSQTVRETCAMARRYKKACSSRDSFVELIAFQPKHFPLDRRKLARLDDVGIHEGTAFSISLHDQLETRR